MAKQVRVAESRPQGTVTFLFTDVEGSSRLLQRLGPDDYGEVLGAHRQVLRRAVHRARRVCEAGHGGQILVSSATQGILAAEPQRVRLRDLGEVRLAGFDQPERLFQIVEEGLPEVPTSLRAPRPWREEQPQLLERAGELAALDDAIAATRTSRGRLVVIEGPAGIGKSTLLAEGRERASASGFSVLHARGSELDSAFSFGVVRQLFESALAREDHDRRDALFTDASS